MNRIFKSVFNKAIGAFVAVPEFAKGRVKTSGQSASIAIEQEKPKVSRWAKLSILATAMLLSGQVAFALPTGGAVIGGASVATISTPSATEVDVTSTGSPTSTTSAFTNISGSNFNTATVVQWSGGFNVANGETVKFINSSVTGKHTAAWINIDTNPNSAQSILNGSIVGLTSDGTNITPDNITPILLINPNGMSIGASAVLPSTFAGVAGNYDTSTGILSLNNAPITIDPAYTVNTTPAANQTAGDACMYLRASIAAPDANGVSNNTLPFFNSPALAGNMPADLLTIMPSGTTYGTNNTNYGLPANIDSMVNASTVNFTSPSKEGSLQVTVPYVLDNSGGGAINFNLSPLSDMGAYNGNITGRRVGIQVIDSVAQLYGDSFTALPTPANGWSKTTIDLPTTPFEMDEFGANITGDLTITGGSVTTSGMGFSAGAPGGRVHVDGSAISVQSNSTTGETSTRGIQIVGGYGVSLNNSVLNSDSGMIVNADFNYGYNSGMGSAFDQTDTGLDITGTQINDNQTTASNWATGVTELSSNFNDAGVRIDANSSINSTGGCDSCEIGIGTDFYYNNTITSPGYQVGNVDIASPINSNGASVYIGAGALTLEPTAAINLTGNDPTNQNGAQLWTYTKADTSSGGSVTAAQAITTIDAPINVTGSGASVNINNGNYSGIVNSDVNINAPITINGDYSWGQIDSNGGNVNVNAPITETTTYGGRYNQLMFNTKVSYTTGGHVGINAPLTTYGNGVSITTGSMDVNSSVNGFDYNGAQDLGFYADGVQGDMNVNAGNTISTAGGISISAENGTDNVNILGNLSNTEGSADTNDYITLTAPGVVTIGSGASVLNTSNSSTTSMPASISMSGYNGLTIDNGANVVETNNSTGASPGAGQQGVTLNSGNGAITINGNVTAGGSNTAGNITISGDKGVTVAAADGLGNGVVSDTGPRSVGDGISINSQAGMIDVEGDVTSTNNSVTLSTYTPSMGPSFPATWGPITIGNNAHVRGVGSISGSSDGQIWINSSSLALSSSNKETSNNGVLYSTAPVGTFNSDNTTTQASTSGMTGSVNLNGYVTSGGWLDAGHNGPAITDLFIDPVFGSSTYGTNPLLGFVLVDGNGNPYSFTDGTSIIGAASYLNAPTAHSSVGSYTYSYNNGLSLSGANAGNYALQAGAQTADWTITPKPITESVTAANKQYDGNTNATVTSLTVNGIIAGDQVSFGYGNAAFDTPIVGNGKTVTVSGITASGADAGNYLVTPVETTTADITPVPTPVPTPAPAQVVPPVDIVVSTDATNISVSRNQDGAPAATMVGNTLLLNVSSDQKPLQIETTSTGTSGNTDTQTKDLEGK